jgi:hypothetical protein
MKVNYLAVLVAAVVYFFLGGVWYGFFFHDAWAKWELPLAPSQNPPHIGLMYLCAFVMGLILCWALAWVCEWRGANAVSGAGYGLLMWVGFVMTTSYTAMMFEGRPRHLFAINYGYCLVGMTLAGLIVGGWKRKAA